jgi:hypothetical protein
VNPIGLAKKSVLKSGSQVFSLLPFLVDVGVGDLLACFVFFFLPKSGATICAL